MPLKSLFKKLCSRTSESIHKNHSRQASKEDEEYHSESNPCYLKLLQAASGKPLRPIRASSIPRDNWSFADQEVWIFRTLVEVCHRPDYNAYDIAKTYSMENDREDLYLLDEEDWSKILGSWKDGATVHSILRNMERRRKPWFRNTLSRTESEPESKVQQFDHRDNTRSRTTNIHF
ncbi:hypothetical protein BCON_0008g00960 [Botryotinia convoluta]|uniref:Uncharacterized protein n=1 Tax=Botryotinia convoluta TaxID=54673 RepID=A0A4Z1IS26_9HELO|nr:hypothetical protein BCON_0008g00960 [Botryotinia convoluta]